MKLLKTLDKMLGYFPSSKRIQMRHYQAKERFQQYMKSKLGGFFVEVDPGPVGDKEIILRTAVLRQEDFPRRSNPDYYLWSGYNTMLSWLKNLERHSFNIRTVKSILELGCGSARLIRHLRCIDGIQLVGSDVRQDFIDWCQQNVPGVEFYVNDLYPPLKFADENSFDLALADSVFTHIPLETQSLWIEEMYRVLRPGAFLIASVFGRFHQLQLLDPVDQIHLKEEKQIVLDSSNTKATLSTQVIGSWDVFQTRGEILRVFGSVFRVLDYSPGSLDTLILQKPVHR